MSRVVLASTAVTAALALWLWRRRSRAPPALTRTDSILTSTLTLLLRWRRGGKAPTLDRADSIAPILGRRPYLRMPCVSEGSCATAERWKPRPTDVIVITYAKTGTTLLQFMCHSLRMQGQDDSDFEEITQVAPWIDFCGDLGDDPDAEQRVRRPRLYKSHQRLSAINRGGRYICTVRDPVRVVESYYAFYLEKGFLDEGQTLDDFAEKWAYNKLWMPDDAPRTSIWDVYVEFWRCRHCAGVLLVCFEDLVRDLERHAVEVAAFIGVPCDRALAEHVAARCGKEWMGAHASLFDDHWLARRMRERGRSPLVIPPAPKVVSGQHANRLSAATREMLQERWASQVAPITGCATYAEMAAGVPLSRKLRGEA